jgi:hypothetical protein
MLLDLLILFSEKEDDRELKASKCENNMNWYGICGVGQTCGHNTVKNK